MKYSEFKVLLLSKSNNRTVLPDLPQLDEKVFTALKRVAKDTLALRLLVSEPDGFQILRRTDEHMFIRFPSKPTLDTDTIDIDDTLMDALALFVMAGMEIPRAGQLMGMYYKEIELNDDRLVETYLAVASNDSPESSAQERFA